MLKVFFSEVCLSGGTVHGYVCQSRIPLLAKIICNETTVLTWIEELTI